MTGGRVVVLGTTGRNFAAGMSGGSFFRRGFLSSLSLGSSILFFCSTGIAYVLDMAHTFAAKVNKEMVELGKVEKPAEIAELRQLLEDVSFPLLSLPHSSSLLKSDTAFLLLHQHRHYTGSEIADRVLRDFHHVSSVFRFLLFNLNELR